MREEPLLKRQGALVGAGSGADGNADVGGFRGGLRTRSIDALPFDAPLDPSFRRQYLHFASRAREVGNGACVTVTATLTVFVFSLCILASVADLPFYLPFMLPMTDKDYDEDRCAADSDTFTKACYGMEACPFLHVLVGFRSVKMAADPCLFLAPHTAMHALMMALVVVIIRATDDAMEPVAQRLFLLATISSVASIPVRKQVPLPGLPGPVQTAYIAALFAAAALGLLALLCVRESHAGSPVKKYATSGLKVAIGTVASLLLVEPALRVYLIVHGLDGVSDTYGGYNSDTHTWEGAGDTSDDRDRPGSGSGHGFYALPSPWSCVLGWALTIIIISVTVSGVVRVLQRIRWARVERSRAISSLYVTDEELEEAEADLLFNFGK